ncbi:amino acid adenylation domain-containing protein [Paenibacillus polysaccharolyticus]|uniref:Amino acid adenylation domain-containing protein n=1 Tax=Paenibacillus polysaccharolyticus TaxID=582692 RepID=A0A1G5E4I3_9BACL|nr:amino acid adenylation domain-containing protein [Paenibacillus polysaccharolyticus]SCY21428.1 amino acid adenylation domain-containing protein [Paenibacillus polysaccharolyticus]
MISNSIEKSNIGKKYFGLYTGFLNNALLKPDHTALIIGSRELSYAEVELTARKWASALIDILDGSPKRVGVFAYRNETSYIGVLAALFSGATFVPLNRNFPTQRTASMIEIAELDALIIDNNSLKQYLEISNDAKNLPKLLLLPDTETQIKIKNTKVLSKEVLEQYEPEEFLPTVTADSLAYILFTSGSTGVPKGVPITHENVCHFIEVNQEKYKFTSEDRFTQTFDQTFDLSVFDLFMAWSAGGTVCSMNPIDLIAPLRFIQEKKVTVWFSVPSIAVIMKKQHMLTPNVMSGLRLSLFCGEALPRGIVELWEQAAPNSIIENLYGPTELTIACAAFRWDSVNSPLDCINDIVPIGKLYPGLEAILVNDTLETVQDNEGGELCVTGPQMFPGYWRNPEQTKEKFLIYKSESGYDTTYYRTGDRVRYLPNGNLIFLGRIDHQIKVNGHRVELSEIEGSLTKLKGIISAVALGWPEENNTFKGIVAFVIGHSLEIDFIRKSLQNTLPPYMIPKHIFIVDKFPMNSNGKIDRNALLNNLDVTDYS